MNVWIVVFVLVDAIIVAAVFAWIMSRRRAGADGAPRPDLAGVERFVREVEPQIHQHMAASHRGDPATLAQSLPALRARIEHQARAAGLALGREAVEAIIARSLATGGIARERDVHRAFEDMGSDSG